MAEERSRRKRRRRRRRGDGDGAVAPAAEREGRAQPPPPDWQWRTFPVFLAFVSGALVMGLLAAVIPGSFLILFYGALFGVAFGLAHMVTRTFVARRRR